MKPRNITLILVLAVSNLITSYPAESQDRSEDFDVPKHFAVYSSDGKNSLTGECRSKTADIVTCNLITVDFLRPGEGDLQKVREEMSKTPRKVREENEKFVIEEMRKDFCSSEGKARLKTKMRDPQIGPKTRKGWQQILEACSAKDPRVFLDSLSSPGKRTCGLFVGTFSLDFKKIGKGQWLSNSGPQGLCNVVTTYVLKRHETDMDAGLLWTLTETTIARDTQGPFCSASLGKELNKPLVWSWENPKTFELPSCDFISPTHVAPDIPWVP